MESKFYQDRVLIYTLAATLSVALFFLSSLTDTSPLNDDGISYLYAAHALTQGDIELATSYRHEVLFYSQIAFTSSATGLTLETSARLLSLMWQIVLALGFIAIIRTFNTSRHTQIIGLLVFTSLTSFNELRPDIIRGFGFWALQIWAIWAAIKFFSHKSWRFAGLWLLCSAASICYRAEGITYLVLVPIAALLTPSFTIKHRVQIAFSILLAALLTAFILDSIIPNVLDRTHQAPTITSTVNKWQNEKFKLIQAVDLFNHIKKSIAPVLPSKWAVRSVNDLIVGGLIFHLIATILKTTNTSLLIISLWNKVPPTNTRGPQHYIIAGYALIGILIGLTSVFTKYFLSARYIMLPSLILCIPITLLLSRSYTAHAKNLPFKTWKTVITFLSLTAIFYPIINSNNNKLYIQEAGHWIKNNIPKNQNIYFNDQKIAYYSGDLSNNSFRKKMEGTNGIFEKGYQYAVLHNQTNRSPTEVSGHNIFQLASFNNEQGQTVEVYGLPPLTKKQQTKR